MLGDGVVDNQYCERLPQHCEMIDGILQYYQAFMRDGLIGLQVLLDRTALVLFVKCAVSVWPVYRRFEDVKIVPMADNGVPGDPLAPQETGSIMKLEPGRYKLGEKCHVIIFHLSSDVKDVQDLPDVQWTSVWSVHVDGSFNKETGVAAWA